MTTKCAILSAPESRSPIQLCFNATVAGRQRRPERLRLAPGPAGNLKPAKDKSTDRIDGIVATIMAIGRALLAQEEPEAEYSICDSRLEAPDHHCAPALALICNHSPLHHPRLKAKIGCVMPRFYPFVALLLAPSGAAAIVPCRPGNTAFSCQAHP
jgi:hypothetical protein